MSSTETIKLANYEMQDSPVSQFGTTLCDQGTSELVSAFFGFDSEVPFVSSFFVCRGASGKDAMPMVFPSEVNLSTLQAGDFRVARADGNEGQITCFAPAPAQDDGEFRTILVVGDFGSVNNPPGRVVIKGNLLSSDNRINFIGKSVEVTSLKYGPSMVLAKKLLEKEWSLGQKATLLHFGGGGGCPVNTKQIVRVTWNSGITKPGGKEVDDLERKNYSVTMHDSRGKIVTIRYFTLGDLGDGDNKHKLCLDAEDIPLSIKSPAGLVTDPRNDLNPKTYVKVSKPNST